MTRWPFSFTAIRCYTNSGDTTVVAEGVEDEATLAYLDRLAADYAQGYFIGRPVPPEEITQRLQAEAASPVIDLQAVALGTPVD